MGRFCHFFSQYFQASLLIFFFSPQSLTGPLPVRIRRHSLHIDDTRSHSLMLEDGQLPVNQGQATESPVFTGFSQ